MAAKSWKEWEQPILDLEDAIRKLEAHIVQESDPLRKAELETRLNEFRGRLHRAIEVRYSRLGPWEKVLVARADSRPYSLDYINGIFEGFTELDGDRRYGTDHAIVGGPAKLNGQAVMIVGQQKGRNIQERTHRNFAMAKPEGYRKAIRLFEMADRFRMPVVTFVDTPAADPSPDSEGRGISEAIAASMLAMFGLGVPVLSVVIGEGGSGGAIGIAVANRVLMLEHSVYSVIPPEGCAAILWRDPTKGPEAAAALRLTAQSAFELGLVDEILPEPFGGAHRTPLEAIATVRDGLNRHLHELVGQSPESLKDGRYARFRDMGQFTA